jgi:uncharacterized membrane protein YgdD (TMEM256/DUF423 family)
MKDRWFAAGAVLAASAVALGAFGAHGLEPRLTPGRIDTFETAVRYQMWHALGLMLLTFSPRTPHPARILMLVGTLLFSGSLYTLVFTGVGIWGAVAPLGGVSLITGWLVAAWGHLQTRS